MAAVLDERRPKLFAVGVYGLASASLACAVYLGAYPFDVLDRLFTHLSPLVFLIPYAMFLVRSASKRQRIAAGALNVACVVAVAAYIGTRPFWPPPPQAPFAVLVGGVVVVAAAFLLAAIALFFRHRRAYLAGTVASLLIWPALWLDLSASRDFGIYGVAYLAGILAVLGFAMAATATIVRPGAGYWAGLLSSILSWPYLILRELSFSYKGNSWIVLNLPFGPKEIAGLIVAALQILACVLATVATTVSLVRLSPGSWVVRRLPIRSRTWPALALSFVLIAMWFALSVTPYRLPMEHHGVPAEISVVHFEKRGLHSRENRVAVMQDGRFYSCSDVRRPLRYRSDGQCSSGTVQPEEWRPIVDFAKSPKFQDSGTSFRNERPGWNSDTWYVYGDRIGIVVFSSSKNMTPPREMVAWFNEMNTMSTGNAWHFFSADVCFGLCYEPQL